jgi:hypothetical protein
MLRRFPSDPHFPSPGALALACALACTSGCSRAPSELSANPAPSSSQGEHLSDASTFSAPTLPLFWTDPAAWERHQPKTNNRAAEYRIPHASTDAEDADCVVLTFGPRQGGTPEQNLDRWISQFTDQKEAPLKATKPARFSPGGLDVNRVEVAGTYTAMRLPGESASPEPKHGYRLIGAVVQAPNGLWFFKLTGPDATVKAAAHDFDSMIQSVRAR